MFYENTVTEKLEEILNGSYILKEWDKMNLRSNLQEGEDYVLVSSDIWYSHFVHDL